MVADYVSRRPAESRRHLRSILIFVATVGSALPLVTLPGPTARAADAGAASEPVVIEQRLLAAWGKEALVQTQKDLGQPGSNLLAEYGTPDGRRGGDFGAYAFIWPASWQLRALASAVKLQPRVYTKTLNAYADALDQYWIVRGGAGGYAVLPKGSERFYDDNAWMVLAMLDAHEVTQQRRYLARAVETLGFVASGEKKTPGGGIRQREDKEGAVAVCTTAPALVGALRLHRLTRDAKFRQMAERWYAFLMSKEAGVRDPADGLFHELKEGKLAYLSASMLEASLLLHSVTKDEKYLGEAQRIGKSALAHWFQPDGGMKTTGQWGGGDLCDALLDLYEVDHDARWCAAVHGVLQFVHKKGRDRNGRYGERWNEDRSGQVLAKYQLLHTAPVTRAYWHAAAVKPPSP
jgi:predicted alpha-1,6-mannanase (GH76 family)